MRSHSVSFKSLGYIETSLWGFKISLDFNIQSLCQQVLILVGEPGAGKTTLAEKLHNPDYKLNPNEEMTKGIDVKRWNFHCSHDTDFRANIWDFGGQHIMHATHRYFLTKRSLYCLVADNRKEDTDFFYWLNMLELFSGKSPVIIVLNEKFKYKKSVPENILKSFDCVKEVCNINLATQKGLSDLTELIQQHMAELPHVGKDPIPKKWVRIREALEKETKDYISRDDFLNLCKQHGIKEKTKALYISEFLHDLGVVLHFQKDQILRNTVILNTRWATEAVYLVLFDEKVTDSGGEFDISDLDRIWNVSQYNNKHADLLQLMINFELCYEIGRTQKYIIPELLPEKSSADKKLWANENIKKKESLHFEYRYDFMPKGIISRLIVRMKKYIYKKQQWKFGVVLKNGDNRAKIDEYYSERVLRICIVGNDRLETLAVIRSHIKELHDSFENLVPYEMVPCNCPECQKSEVPNFFDYDELKQYYNEGEKYIRCRVGKIKKVNVLSLITDVFIQEKPGDMEKRGEKIHIDFNPNIVIEGSKAVVDFKADTNVETNINIAIDIKVDLPAIQDDFIELKEAITDDNPKLEKELDKIGDSLNTLSAGNDEKYFNVPMNNMRQLLKKVADKNSDFHNAVKGVKKGVELAQKVGKTYNKFAQWLAMPQIPDLFL